MTHETVVVPRIRATKPAVKWLRVSDVAVDVLLPGAMSVVGVSRRRIDDFNDQYADYLARSRGPLITPYSRDERLLYAADGPYGRIIRTEPYDPKFILEHPWTCLVTPYNTRSAYTDVSHIPMPTRTSELPGVPTRRVQCPTCGANVLDVTFWHTGDGVLTSLTSLPRIVTCLYGCIRAPDIADWVMQADAAFGDVLAMILADDPSINDGISLVEPGSVAVTHDDGIFAGDMFSDMFADDGE